MDIATLRNVLDHRVEISPVTGRPRFKAMHNDVLFYIERLGGSAKAAAALGVFHADVELWIDEHHVPQPFADQIHKLTGAYVSLIREPPTVVIGDACVWPPVRSGDIQMKLGLPPLAENGSTTLAGR
ncbi:hypothetical protein E2553_16150 [Paraburkholderia dipogonis]|uniref:Uncharacterized protein n=1 Tax=Paraburkholderia dipogonis TaxID=1211383 RepID=A0A4Y8N9Q4_9BURK|nr:hypothetical protein [Paraburkholderia dipogonis]TFE46425.1 hypothetical protein E2553_16150 [Paraburkholderia dipogonis]